MTVTSAKFFTPPRSSRIRSPSPGAGHATIGGTDQNGNAAYNALTGMVIRGIRGLRTPNVSLRVRDDMPDEIWEDYLYNIGHGCTQPAAVSEKLFLERLTADYGIPFADAVNYTMVGCNEPAFCGAITGSNSKGNIARSAAYLFRYHADTIRNASAGLMPQRTASQAQTVLISVMESASSMSRAEPGKSLV